MDYAIWLLSSVPQTFFATMMAPLKQGYVSAVPAVGAYCLGIGVLLGLVSRRSQLLLFLIPLGFSLAMIAIAGFFYGRFDPGSLIDPGMLAFVCVQALLAVYLATRVDGARMAAAALAVFSVAHAVFVSDIAAKAFTDTLV